MLGRILTRLFALFGVTTTCVACYGVGYEEYHPEYITTGRVVDTEGNAIKGIWVETGGCNTRTSANGEFTVYGNSRDIWFEDDDGEANGGEFEGHNIRVPQYQYTNNIGDVELKRKTK